MAYQQGDCLTLQDAQGKYMIVFIAAADEKGYHLAFLDYHAAEPPPQIYFNTCSFWVVSLGMADQLFSALDVVTIVKPTLDNAGGVKLIMHIDMPGAFSLNGMVPVDSVTAIADWYQQNFAQPVPLPKSRDFSSFTRKLMPLDEIKKLAIPADPFPTVKLYRREDGVILFWHIYGIAGNIGIVVAWGKLGQYEGYQEIMDDDISILKNKYADLIEEKQQNGFAEWTEHSNMILQFATADGWGDVDDLDFRNQVGELLDRNFFWTGSGATTGGDIGSGTVNIFFKAVLAEIAVQIIIQSLAEQNINRSFIIALETNTGGDEQEIAVVHPQDYGSKFHY